MFGDQADPSIKIFRGNKGNILLICFRLFHFILIFPRLQLSWHNTSRICSDAVMCTDEYVTDLCSQIISFWDPSRVHRVSQLSYLIQACFHFSLSKVCSSLAESLFMNFRFRKEMNEPKEADIQTHFAPCQKLQQHLQSAFSGGTMPYTHQTGQYKNVSWF